MSESTIVLPIEVKDEQAIRELKKIQAQLGAVGKESAAVNAALAKSMDAVATKAAAAYGDIAAKIDKVGAATKRLEGFAKGLITLEVGKKFIQWGADAAKFAMDFKRLEASVPVKRLRELQIETDGTVSKFELLKRASKDALALPVDEATKNMLRTQAAWEDFVDRVKVGVGSVVMEVARGIAILTGLMDYSKSEKIQGRARDRANKRTPGLSLQNQGQLGFLPNGEAWAAGQIGGQYAQDRASQIMAGQVVYAQELAGSVREQQLLDINEKVNQQVELSKLPGYTNKPNKKRGGGGRDQSTPWWTQLAYNTQRDTSFLRTDLAGLGRGALGVLGDIGKGDSGQRSAGLDFIGGGEAGMGDLAKKMEEDREASEELLTSLRDQGTEIGAIFSGVTSGITAAMDAVISGEESVGKAIKKALSQELKAIAIKNTILAAEQAALAIGAAASYRYDSAAAHGVAAAKHAAVAILAGGSAAALGGGGGGGGAASGRAGAAGGGPSPTGSRTDDRGPQNITVNVVVGAAADHGKLGEVIVKAIDKGKQSGRVRDDRQVTVQYE